MTLPSSVTQLKKSRIILLIDVKNILMRIRFYRFLLLTKLIEEI